MKKVNAIGFSRILACVLLVLVMLTSCSKNEIAVNRTSEETKENLLSWIIEPCIDAEDITPLAFPVFNENTNHYDFTYSKYFSIKTDGKCGLIDTYGGNAVNATYDSIFAIRNGDDYIGLNGKNQTYIHSDTFETESAYKKYNTVKYEYYYNSTDKKVYFIKNTSGSVKTKTLNITMPEVVVGVKNSNYDKDGTYGLYVNNKEVTGMAYTNAGYFTDGLVAVEKNGKWGYIDSQGTTVIPFEMSAVKGYNAFSGDDTPYESSEGFVAVCKDGKFAFYTNTGTQLCDFAYDDATPCVDGRAYVLYNGKWGVVSLNDDENIISETATVADKTTTTKTQTTVTTTVESTTAENTVETKEYIVNTDTLYLREEIGSDKIITALDMDDVVTSDMTSNGWAHLVFDDCEGWVKLEYLREAE